MTDIQAVIFQKVADHIRETMDRGRLVDARDPLDELGIDSMALIAILVMLEQEFGLDVDRMASASPPKTLDELVAIAVHALPTPVVMGNAEVASPVT